MVSISSCVGGVISSRLRGSGGYSGLVCVCFSVRLWSAVVSPFLLASQRCGNTGCCEGGKVLGRFASGGGTVSASKCRCGSLSPGFRGRDGCFGSVGVCVSVCFVALSEVGLLMFGGECVQAAVMV